MKPAPIKALTLIAVTAVLLSDLGAATDVGPHQPDAPSLRYGVNAP